MSHDPFSICFFLSDRGSPAKYSAPEAEFLDEIQTIVLRVFLLVIHSHLFSFALSFLFLQTLATSYSFCKGERRKPDRKPYHLPYGLRIPYRNLKSKKSMPGNLNLIVRS